MADCNPEMIVCLWNTFELAWDYLGLHKICILKKTSSKGA